VHDFDLILTLTAGLGAALTFGFIALRLRLPPIVGYLVAGLLIGPHTPGFVANRAIAEQLVLSPKTVSNNVSNVLQKLQAVDRAKLMLMALEAGLGQPDNPRDV